LRSLRSFIEKGADVNAQLSDGTKLLTVAKEKKFNEIAQELIEAGAKK
jgi:ankyrin repeat protein